MPKAADAEARVTLKVQAVTAYSTANVDKDAHEQSYALANPPSPVMESFVGDVEKCVNKGKYFQ